MFKFKLGHTKTCAHCDKVFHASKKTAKYCSDACKMQAYRRRVDPQVGSRERKRQQARAAINTKIRNDHRFTCPVCGREMVVSQLHSLQEYCTPACRQAAYRNRKSAS